MQETLFNAYLPLVIWSGLGFILGRFLPEQFPRFLGRSLYWVGIPLEILALARRTNFSVHAEVPIIMTVGVLGMGLLLTWLGWVLSKEKVSQWLTSELTLPFPSLSLSIDQKAIQGGFFLSSLLGNTNFIGLSLAPLLLPDEALSLVVLYSVTNNVMGSYGLGVWLASYFGSSGAIPSVWRQIRSVLIVPSLWAFLLGYFSQNLAFPSILETNLQKSLSIVIPVALSLIGIRLSQIPNRNSWLSALPSVGLKIIAIPATIGLLAKLINLDHNTVLTLVLMSGMPTALAALILAEEYKLASEMTASSILLSTVLLLAMIPLWLWIFA